MGWTEHKQVRYATARSTFRWDGTDSVKVGSDETQVRVLDEEVTTDQATGITASGWTKRANPPVLTVSRCRFLPGEGHPDQGGEIMKMFIHIALLASLTSPLAWSAGTVQVYTPDSENLKP